MTSTPSTAAPEASERERRVLANERTATGRVSRPAGSERDIRTVACFDFDGTLSSRDNFMRFVHIVAGTRDTARAVAAAAPTLLAARHDPTQRDVAKAIVLRHTLRGRRESSLRDLGARYARLVVAEHLNTEVCERLHAHRAAGHDVAIVSASLHLYLDPIAGLLGVPTVLATEMEVGPDGRLTGEIVGPNVRGAEKARRLDAWLDAGLGGAPTVIHAYGDSDGDAELLARADHPVLVDRRGRVPVGTARIDGETSKRPPADPR